MATLSILVTGSSGTIGTGLVQRLLAQGCEVNGVDIRPNRWSDQVEEVTELVDLRDENAVDALPTDVDMIIHLAAHARVHRLVEDPTGAKENLEMVFNVLEHARQADIPQVVFGSSREVYGNKEKIVYSEKDTFADKCESPYTASKIGGEALVKSYEKCYGIDTCILRFSNVYGKYDASDRVVPLFTAQAHAGENLTVYGDEKVLDFTYIDDCVRGIHKTAENFNKTKGTTLNIASGEGTSLLELAQEVATAVPADINIHVKESRTGEINRYVADISKAQKLIDYAPEYRFTRGIEKSLQWYQEHDHLFSDIRQ